MWNKHISTRIQFNSYQDATNVVHFKYLVVDIRIFSFSLSLLKNIFLNVIKITNALKIFKKNSKLFHSLRPTHERILKPRLVLWFGIHKLLSDLHVKQLYSIGKYISDIYAGENPAKKSNSFVPM